MQSNNLANYGDNQFNAVHSTDDIPKDAVLCPFEAAKINGVENDKRPKCGDCTHCIDKEFDKDVYITIH